MEKRLSSTESSGVKRSISCCAMPSRYLEEGCSRGPSIGALGICDVLGAGRKNAVHVEGSLDHCHAMQPVLCHFKVLGLWKKHVININIESKKPWKGLKIRCWIFLTILFALMVFKVATAISYALTYGIKVAPTAISDTFELVVGLGTTVHLFKNQTRISSSFNKNWTMLKPFPRSRIVTLKRKAIFLVILAWIYFVLLLGQAIAVIWITPSPMMKYYFFKNCEGCPIIMGYIIRTSRGVAYCFVRFICVLNIVLYVMLCLQLKETLKQLLTHFEDCSNRDRINTNHIVELMQIWDAFSSLVKDIDNTYSAVVFLWYSDLLHRIVHYFPTGIDMFGNGNVLDGSVLATLAIFYSFLFISITISASSIADCSEDLLHLLRRMTCKLQQQDPYVYNNMVILMSTLNYRNVYLTGWDCFAIRKYLILTVLGMVMTYIVLINQIIHN